MAGGGAAIPAKSARLVRVHPLKASIDQPNFIKIWNVPNSYLTTHE
jgi:hypothetical protein